MIFSLNLHQVSGIVALSFLPNLTDKRKQKAVTSFLSTALAFKKLYVSVIDE